MSDEDILRILCTEVPIVVTRKGSDPLPGNRHWILIGTSSDAPSSLDDGRRFFVLGKAS